MSNPLETLYYDGQCPLCNAEMSRLGAYEPTQLKLVDIHQVEMDELTKHRMLKVLHLETADGTFKTGIEANIAAWEHTRWGFAWRWLRLPVIRWLGGIVYNAWAANRYSRLYGKKPASSSDG
jgi:predicted DCC family thiol-disulfide oxidoreductase YuxK